LVVWQKKSNHLSPTYTEMGPSFPETSGRQSVLDDSVSILPLVFIEPILNLTILGLFKLPSSTKSFWSCLETLEIKCIHVYRCFVCSRWNEAEDGRSDGIKSKKSTRLMTFNQDRGGNRLRIYSREVIFARFNYRKLAKCQLEMPDWIASLASESSVCWQVKFSSCCVSDTGTDLSEQKRVCLLPWWLMAICLGFWAVWRVI